MTPERLRRVLDYNPETGLFTRRCNVGKRWKIGDKAGSPHNHGYVQIAVDGRKFLAHRLAWLWMTGEWPTFQIDHIDTNRANNQWANLRQASQSQNLMNSSCHYDNSSGIKGVSWSEERQKWVAQIRIAGKNRQLGRFNSKQEAADCYNAAARLHFGEYARPSMPAH